jgi:peptidoglycan/xylan/chitin deacetylase (PgdA/CDA1 family)
VLRALIAAALGLATLSGAPAPPTPGTRAERVPVLMYHVVDSAPPGTPEPRLWVPRSQFAAEMNDLASRGYHVVTLQQVWDSWRGGTGLPGKPIVVSFDDGYASQYRNALPILRAHHWPGVLNLEVAALHTTLRASETRGLIRAGWEVDSHTMTHPDLTRVGPARLRYEVAGSRSWIRARFGVPVNFFCYPSGRYDARVIAAVKAAGYLAATTTRPAVAGPRWPRYELPRIRVDAGEPRATFDGNLTSAVGRSSA